MTAPGAGATADPRQTADTLTDTPLDLVLVHKAANRYVDYCTDGKIVAVDTFDSAPQKIFPAPVLCQSTDLIGNLFGQGHRRVGRMITY